MFAATIALAKEAGLTAVAVGIETNRQLALARELDCSVGQGFLLHRPGAPERLRFRDPAGAVTSAPWRPLRATGRQQPAVAERRRTIARTSAPRPRRPPSWCEDGMRVGLGTGSTVALPAAGARRARAARPALRRDLAGDRAAPRARSA